MADDDSGKGEKLEADGDKELKKMSLFNPHKHEKALDIYEKAANQYKLNKKWRQAGEVYLKMATLCKSSELKDPGGAATNTHRAAEAFQNHGDLTRSLASFRSAAQTLFDTNRAPAAAKCWTEIAKIEEKEGRLSEAKEAWEKCAVCHEEGKASALAVQARLNIARVLSLQGHLDQAAAMWERIAAVEAEGELSRWACTDYYFKAGICQLVVDAKFTGAGVEAKNVSEALARYVEQYPAFETTRECKFLHQLVNAFTSTEAEALDKFTTAIQKWNAITALDSWTAKQLIIVQRVLKGLEDDGVKKAGAPTDADLIAGPGRTTGTGTGIGTAAKKASAAVSGDVDDLQ